MIVGVVLAGGKSSRMGQDKAALRAPTSNTSLLDKSLTLLAQAGANNVLVSGDGYEIPDQYKDIGPLGGIYSSFNFIKKRFVEASGMLCLPVDMPNISALALNALWQAGLKYQSASFYVESVLPLFLPISAEVENEMRSAVLAQQYSIYKFIQALPHNALESPNQTEFTNVNTPQEWQNWCAAELK